MDVPHIPDTHEAKSWLSEGTVSRQGTGAGPGAVAREVPAFLVNALLIPHMVVERGVLGGGESRESLKPCPSSLQHYGPSVITSLDEQDTLGHFFQFRGAPSHFLGPLAPTLGSSHRSSTPAPPPGRVSSIVAPGSSLREGHGGPLPSGPSLTGCRSDVISLD